MEQRINFFEKGAGATKVLFGLNHYLGKSPVEQSIFGLINIRVSQINGCAYCLNADTEAMLARGENVQRLFVLNAWREAPFYTDRERAALAWAEAVTMVTEGHVPDAVYEMASKEFSQEELIDLTMAVTTINTYNRMNIAFRTPADAQRPWEKTVAAK